MQISTEKTYIENELMTSSEARDSTGNELSEWQGSFWYQSCLVLLQMKKFHYTGYDDVIGHDRILKKVHPDTNFM